MSETPGKSASPVTPVSPVSPVTPQPGSTTPATLVTQQAGNSFITPQFTATGYSGPSFSHPFELFPPPGTTFPSSTPNSVVVTATDNLGTDTGTVSNVTSTTGQVNVTAGASTTRPSGLGTGLKITITVTYAPGDTR